MYNYVKPSHISNGIDLSGCLWYPGYMANILCFNCGLMFEVPYFIKEPTDKCPKCNPAYYHEVNCACMLCMPWCSYTRHYDTLLDFPRIFWYDVSMTCTKYGCDYELDLDGQVTCTVCGAMDDDSQPVNLEGDFIWNLSLS